VVASLWSVPDVESRVLMEKFYQNHWEKNMSPLEALHKAQLAMIEAGDVRGAGKENTVDPAKLKRAPEAGKTKERLSPYYWAAFVLSGDWR
jgi:CHAT domain-containing protein